LKAWQVADKSIFLINLGVLDRLSGGGFGGRKAGKIAILLQVH
jgi:hypothetical protein